MTLITASETISGKTFAGGPVNACSVEPGSGVATGGGGIRGYKLQPTWYERHPNVF